MSKLRPSCCASSGSRNRLHGRREIVVGRVLRGEERIAAHRGDLAERDSIEIFGGMAFQLTSECQPSAAERVLGVRVDQEDVVVAGYGARVAVHVQLGRDPTACRTARIEVRRRLGSPARAGRWRCLLHDGAARARRTWRRRCPIVVESSLRQRQGRRVDGIVPRNRNPRFRAPLQRCRRKVVSDDAANTADLLLLQPLCLSPRGSPPSDANPWHRSG